MREEKKEPSTVLKMCWTAFFKQLEEENSIQTENDTRWKSSQTSQKNCRTQNFLRTPRIMSTLPLIDLFGQIRKELVQKAHFYQKMVRGTFFLKGTSSFFYGTIIVNNNYPFQVGLPNCHSHK